MARRRYISTDISTDIKLAELAEYGVLPLLLYTWAIPHMDDWGRITGDPRQFKLTVCPGLDVSSVEVGQALDQIASVGLWIQYIVDGKLCISIINPDKWFKHQSYINKGKRDDDSGSNFKSPEFADDYRKTPQNAEEHQELPHITEIQQGTAQIAASLSLSPSLSPSPSENHYSSYSPREQIPNIYKFFETEGFGKITEMTREYLIEMEETYTATWVYHAMKAAVKQGVTKIAYIQKILKGWETKNHDEPWTLEKEEQQPPVQSNVTPIKGKYQKGPSGKPSIPVIMPDTSPSTRLTEEELAAARAMAEKLDQRFNKGAGAS